MEINERLPLMAVVDRKGTLHTGIPHATFLCPACSRDGRLGDTENSSYRCIDMSRHADCVAARAIDSKYNLPMALAG